MNAPLGGIRPLPDDVADKSLKNDLSADRLLRGSSNECFGHALTAPLTAHAIANAMHSLDNGFGVIAVTKLFT